jgi:3-hydroxymyristoyl/3-hydroxydecanoyl-(acyl carrier protein) dehydratase
VSLTRPENLHVLQTEEGTWESAISFTGEEIYFADHFPGFPLVPGVLLFEAMREAAQAVLEREHGTLRLRQSTRLRLIRPCHPPITVQVRIKIDPEEALCARCEVLDESGRKMATVRHHFEIKG